jgi:hypothetical protein
MKATAKDVPVRRSVEVVSILLKTRIFLSSSQLMPRSREVRQSCMPDGLVKRKCFEFNGSEE